MALADSILKQPGIENARRAGSIDPWNPKPPLLEAQYADQEASPKAAPAWRRAADLDPRNPRILIPAGISAELTGNKAVAENYYRTAERFNHTWLPRWTLANFYFRAGNQAETLQWLRKSMERSHGDLTAAFELAEQSGANEEQILTEIVPKEPYPLAGFLWFLSRKPATPDSARVIQIAASRYVAAFQAATRSGAGIPTIADAALPLLAATGSLIQGGMPLPAKRVWSSACESKLASCSSPIDDGLITNGRFSVPFLQQGFDWRLEQPSGTTVVQQTGTGTVKITLRGSQPETARFLLQPLYVPAASAWRVRFEYQTRDILPRQSGFEWQLDGVALALPAPLASEDWAESSFDIPASPGDRVSTLAFFYARKPGTTRSEGELWLRNVRAERAK